MIEEPYRWLEAISNRREYVRDQLKGGSPVLAASLNEGILVLGVGTGQSKVFELFDRHALGGLGHPADLEKLRQAAIDAAHLEAFTRAPEDVSLRRLVGFGLSAQLKTNFEQIFSAPFLIELLLAELGREPRYDTLVRLHFDGSFQFEPRGVAVAASDPEAESAAQSWLAGMVTPATGRTAAAEWLLQAWWCLTAGKAFAPEPPPEPERREGWRKSAQDRVVELGWLARQSPRLARYEALSVAQLNL